MKTIKFIAALLFIFVLISGCAKKETDQTTPPPSTAQNADHLVISEIMAGVSGNNNLDFIELYNPTLDVIDLQGYSLWFQLAADQPDILLYSWETTSLVPPHGHYFLLRDKQEMTIEPDAFFDYPLVPQRGSLALRLRGEPVVDQVAWGNTDALFVEGAKAGAFQNGTSLERLPGADAGNGVDTNDNSSDFTINKKPNPQSSASVPVPAYEVSFSLTVNAPTKGVPGSELEYLVAVENTSREPYKNVAVHFPSPVDLEYQSSTLEPAITDGWLIFSLGEMEAGAAQEFTVNFKAPWKYTTITCQGIHVKADGETPPVFTGALRTAIEEGAVPVGIARTLLGSEGVIIEGTATMYTGGLYAGSSGTKFYLADETGGVQVYVPGGMGKVEIPLGAYVRVRGMPQPYRGAIEIIPSPEEVILLKNPEENPLWEPLFITVEEFRKDAEQFVGKLVSVSGEVTRVEEFSYSYEIDLQDGDDFINAYVDKLTAINVETMEVGQYYQLTGIIEKLDDKYQIYPRLQADLLELQPPTVTLDADVPVNYVSGETIPVQFTVANYLDEAINNLTMSVSIPTGLNVLEVSDGGAIKDGEVAWSLPQLAGDGATAEFSLTASVPAAAGYLAITDYYVTYSGQSDELNGETVYSFPGDTVPVWAIQGSGFRSSYLLEEVQTTGVVTGVFPEMDGFWIQGEDDGDALTSQGLFVFKETNELLATQADPGVVVGDRIKVRGVIHESHEETQLFFEEMEKIASGQQLPQAISLNPPVNNEQSVRYFEALEGMLVEVDGSVRAATPTNKYGETAVVFPSVDIQHLMIGDENGMAIRLDDGSTETHTDQSSMLYAAKTGDLLSGIRGPLGFNYGYYKIQPLSIPVVVSQERLITELPQTESGELRVMTWNVENMFDFLEPNPSDLDLPTVDEYKALLDKIAGTIRLAGYPGVIGFQEVEHVGILEDLAERPAITEWGYQAVLLEGTDSRGIDVGYLVRGDLVINNVQQFPAPEGLTSRPPLLLEVQFDAAGVTQTLYLLNNHFLSMSGGEKATEPRRIAQAAWNVELVEQILAENPEAQVAVLGDLNSYYESPPIDVLRESGMIHVLDRLEPEERYTYIYQGIAEVLDHILVNENLDGFVTSVDIIHTNADFPLQAPGDTSPLHKSDHDPVVITISYR